MNTETTSNTGLEKDPQISLAGSSYLTESLGFLPSKSSEPKEDAPAQSKSPVSPLSTEQEEQRLYAEALLMRFRLQIEREQANYSRDRAHFRSEQWAFYGAILLMGVSVVLAMVLK